VAFPLLQTPVLTAPTDGMTGVSLGKQSLSWMPMSRPSIYIVTISPVKPSSWALSVVTASTSFVLPSPSEMGLPGIDGGTSLSWRVTGHGGQGTTTDELADPAHPNPLYLLGGPITGSGPASSEVWSAGSATQQFTTE
jgi:hypothetical protein